MKKKLAYNLSANTLQLVINQLFGVLIFYVLSVGLDKNTFGQLNLALAILLSAFNILSFGIDQVVIKKVADGEDAKSVLSVYAFHVVLTGVLFYSILLLGGLILVSNDQVYTLVLLIGAGKLMIFLSTPLKQVTSGLERFKLLSYMLVTSNIVRGLSLVVLALLHVLSIQNIIWIFIGGDALELMVCVLLFRRYVSVPIMPRWNKIAYVELLKQSLPQVGVVLITSALARFDWLFIGLILSAVKLAEYSFAYKIFEISTLPLLAIAPILIPRFTRLFKNDGHKEVDIKLLVRFELIIAALTGLLLNICWNPVVDLVTHGKYGAVNTNVIFILSLCLPFLYLNNFLWTIFFVQNQLKMIFRSFVITFTVNVVGDIVLIPFFKNEGAAISFLAACLVQATFYISKNNLEALKGSMLTLFICTACALVSGFLTKFLFQNTWIAAISSVILYFAFLLITAQIKRSDRKGIICLFNW
ncbi:oligosaccharide flippase family protein [Mucilaginibacter dorajii]|uniref:Polysaccharide biosynthesis protein C-terminal domain-containing protein n=1 Tax=Mucilaginibacter dorajii TaxID=692994 RepID=A0ABP7R9G2_9SPHI|nr:oligosaccharide flippase family protein [Mucilaginibacter dorajii]MCS3737322.1 O-antigen/teichoic acid export membrane protein [Mucilaginibacter dorajii]